MEQKITLYQHSNFGGKSLELTSAEKNFVSRQFNDQTSSVKVVGRPWVMYEHVNYNGKQYVMEEGEYRRPGIFDNDQISSSRPINVDADDEPRISVYQHSNFGGIRIDFDEGHPNLTWFNFNDQLSSAIVHSGAWILYEHANYRGRQWLLEKGKYENWKEWKGANDRVSSLRPVKVPTLPSEMLKLEYDLKKATKNSTSITVTKVSQANDCSEDRQATWDTAQSVTQTNIFSLDWENTTTLSISNITKVRIPQMEEKELEISDSNTITVGGDHSNSKSETQEITYKLSSKVKSKTRLTVCAVIYQCMYSVPFKALMQRKNHRWTERGTFRGIQYYGLKVTHDEKPL